MISNSLRVAAVIGASATTLVFAPAAHAETASSTLNVNASVTEACTVSTTPVDFGNVDTLSGTDVDSAGGITVTCTNGTDWSAGADIGGGTGATLSSRKMSFGSNLLDYTLFTDSSHTTVWGDGTASSVTIDSTGTGTAQAVPIYGRIPSGQTSAPAGDYADTVAVTITY